MRLRTSASDVWTFDALSIEPRRHLAPLKGEALDLSPREFRLILELAHAPGLIVSKGVLAQRMGPLGEPIDFGAIEVQTFNLRSKIGAERIKTVRGVGYMLVA